MSTTINILTIPDKNYSWRGKNIHEHSMVLSFFFLSNKIFWPTDFWPPIPYLCTFRLWIWALNLCTRVVALKGGCFNHQVNRESHGMRLMPLAGAINPRVNPRQYYCVLTYGLVHSRAVEFGHHTHWTRNWPSDNIQWLVQIKVGSDYTLLTINNHLRKRKVSLYSAIPTSC